MVRFDLPASIDITIVEEQKWQETKPPNTMDLPSTAIIYEIVDYFCSLIIIQVVIRYCLPSTCYTLFECSYQHMNSLLHLITLLQ